jgi:ribosomal protein S18 acetylase RimI-like enzyme
MTRSRTMMIRTFEADDRQRPAEDGSGLDGRAPDVAGLAALMLDAYRGTIDDEGETMHDAVGAVEALLEGEFGTLDEAASVVFHDLDLHQQRPVAATFVTHFDGHPLIAFSMTHPGAVRSGFARRGLHHAFGVLARAGWSDVRLVVTDGNDRAIALYESEGFAAAT